MSLFKLIIVCNFCDKLKDLQNSMKWRTLQYWAANSSLLKPWKGYRHHPVHSSSSKIHCFKFHCSNCAVHEMLHLLPLLEALQRCKTCHMSCHLLAE